MLMSPTSPNGQAGESRSVEDLIRRVVGQVRAMRSLQPNWDGYNADAPCPAVLKYAEQFLDVFLRQAAEANGGRTDFALFVAPARDGGLFVETELPPVELEFDIRPDLAVNYLRTNTVTAEQEEGSLKHPPDQPISELSAILIEFLQPA
jgi:hypothetical protein